MVEEYYRLNKARNFAEWQRALALQGVPATNFLYADAAGNIAYFYNASFPNRKPGFDYAHVLPGDTSRDYAPGTVPWRMVPRNVDPGSGFLVNANSTPFESAGAGYEIEPASVVAPARHRNRYHQSRHPRAGADGRRSEDQPR